MPITEKFLAARSAEHRQRLISYLPFAESLRLPIMFGRLRVVSIPQQHVTLAALIDLELVRNPFITGGQPTRWDVYRVLWRLHPRYSRHGGALARLWLSILCGLCLWPATVGVVKERLGLAYQDAPSADVDATTPAAAPQSCAPDDLCHLFTANYGLSREQILAAPIAWLLQVLRSAALSQPEAELNVIDPSDRFLSA